MLFTTTLLLALTCLVSAAPVVERDSQCDSGLKNGKYVDEGCGENLKPTRTADLCLQTDWITAEHSSVILTACSSNWGAGATGGRWAFRTGNTHMVNRAAETADYCLSANTDYTGVEMTRCSGQTRQTWNWDGKRMKLFEKDLCLSSTGTPLPEKGNAFKLDKTARVTLGPCTQGADHTVQLITTFESMDYTESQGIPYKAPVAATM